jgi:glycosyltransferase involved in cell wall biosynthesis
MKKLKIAQIAPIWYPLPPQKYAGVERIVAALTNGLVERGHKVTLFATGNSKTKARLKFIRKKSLTEDKIPWQDVFGELYHLSFAFKNLKNYDIAHCHTDLKAIFFQDFTKTPVLHTIHHPLFKNQMMQIEILKKYQQNLNFCFVSKSAKKLYPVRIKNSWVVYNGVDLNNFSFNSAPKDFLLWVGRVEPYKGIENAILAAQIAKRKLFLVGKIDKEKGGYFEKKIKPHLSDKIKYLGELDHKKLSKIYQEAQALLYPIEWPEPFGLVMVEAQACGTPVIVFNQGAASELVINGQTGFVVPFLNEKGEKNIEGIVKAIKNINSIKRENCRKNAEKFSLNSMIENYEKIYYEILAKN